MVTTRRSGKSSDKEERETRKSERTHDEEMPQPRLDEEFSIERDQRMDMMESGGGEDNDSGDDMPEQVTFATGKESAARRRLQETQAKRKVQEEAKERRRKRQSKKDVEGEEPGMEEDDEVNEEDILPADIVEALVRAEEEDELAQDRRLSERKVVTEQLRNIGNAPSSRRVVFSEERPVGPVTVRLLKPGHRQKASDAAKEFLKGKLYDGVHRSQEMLYPTKGQQLLRLKK